MHQGIASNQSDTSLFSYLLVFLALLCCFACLCCFEEKSNWFSLMRQGLTLFDKSHQIFVLTLSFLKHKLIIEFFENALKQMFVKDLKM
jgi:hypothetical protein